MGGMIEVACPVFSCNLRLLRSRPSAGGKLAFVILPALAPAAMAAAIAHGDLLLAQTLAYLLTRPLPAVQAAYCVRRPGRRGYVMYFLSLPHRGGAPADGRPTRTQVVYLLLPVFALAFIESRKRSAQASRKGFRREAMRRQTLRLPGPPITGSRRYSSSGTRFLAASSLDHSAFAGISWRYVFIMGACWQETQEITL